LFFRDYKINYNTFKIEVEHLGKEQIWKEPLYPSEFLTLEFFTMAPWMVRSSLSCLADGTHWEAPCGGYAA
jgi:hypothetical protein